MATIKQVLVGGAVVLTAVAGLAAYAMYAPEPKGHALARGTKILTRKGKVLTVTTHDGGSKVYVKEEPGRWYGPWQFAVVKTSGGLGKTGRRRAALSGTGSRKAVEAAQSKVDEVQRRLESLFTASDKAADKGEMARYAVINRNIERARADLAEAKAALKTVRNR